VWSTAAGRYQIIARTWDFCQKTLSLPSFNPECQDQAAVLLIKGRKALDLVEAGNIDGAIIKCAQEWASFPGNNYGQHQNPIEGLLSVYRTFGGLVA
jgi:lysozyme